VSPLRKLALAWLALPLTALDWLVAWGRLPARVVMKTNASGQPIHWATREDALRFDLSLVGGVLVFLTIVSALVVALQPEKARQATWGAVVVALFLFLIVNGILWGSQVQ
jgi:hypothetical protein